MAESSAADATVGATATAATASTAAIVEDPSAKFDALLSCNSKEHLEAHSPYGRGGAYMVLNRINQNYICLKNKINKIV